MNQIQTFNKHKLHVDLKNGEKISVPKYVQGARKRFRYSESDSILSKQCSVCLKWFPVAKLEDGQWIDIHDENEIHIFKSGVSSYCKLCSLKKATSKDGASVRTSNKNYEGNLKEMHSIELTSRHKRYVKVCSIELKSTFANHLANILSNETKRYPLKSLSATKKKGEEKRQHIEGDYEKISVKMSEEHFSYLKLRAGILGKSIKEVLSEIIEDEMNRNPSQYGI